jgi:hypothetical protein
LTGEGDGNKLAVSGTAAGGGASERIDIRSDPSVRRGGFLKALAGGVAIAGALWIQEGDGVADAAADRRSSAQDRDILNFALLLEYLKESFYSEALAKGGLSGDLERFARVAGGHEREHVQALKQALGSHARSRPAFHFGARTREPKRFQATAVALEDLAVAAYNAQAANLTTGALAAAIKIVSVEARHAAWIRAVAGEQPAPTAADPGEGVQAVTAALKRLHIQ